MKRTYYVYPSDVPIRKAEDGSVLEREHGMTLWDHYAGQALAGLCASIKYHPTSNPEEVAKTAGHLAALMLAEREKRGMA